MVSDTKLPNRAQTLSNIATYFNRYGDTWKTSYVGQGDIWYGYSPIRLREKYALELIRDEPRGTAVDLGCGIGHALIQMKQMGFGRVVGVDISPSMLADADKLLKSANIAGAIELYSCDVQDLRMIRSRSVDACTALGVIEYLLDDARLMTETSRILKPYGAFVVQMRNYYCLNSRTFRLIEKLVPHYRPRLAYREHRPSVFRSSVAQFGFCVEKERFSHFYAMYPLTSIPVIRNLIRPVDNILSKSCERLSSHGFATFFASTYIVKLRKVSEVVATAV